jgi:hypothetical protein
MPQRSYSGQKALHQAENEPGETEIPAVILDSSLWTSGRISVGLPSADLTANNGIFNGMILRKFRKLLLEWMAGSTDLGRAESTIKNVAGPGDPEKNSKTIAKIIPSVTSTTLP